LNNLSDISLFSTTLRFAASNEVSTVSNGSIASARITNCARSKNATVHLLLKLHISLHEDNNLDLFREALENYARDNPNIWESIVFFRCEEIDSDNEFVTYDFAVRSRQSWQVSPRVLQDRARLHQFCVELAAKLNVKFDSPDPRRVLYYGGSLVEGAVKDYKKDLLSSPNVHSANDLESFLVPGIGSGDVGPLLRPEADEIDKGKPLSGTAVNEHLSNQGGALREAGTEETIDATNNLFLSMLQGSHG
jgi:small-conductance mechanosensitive channel